MSVGDHPLRQALRSRDHMIADRWHRALATTGFVALSTEQVHQHLVAFVDRAIDVLVADAFDHRKAEALGVDLARLYYAHPGALSRTLNILALELLDDLPPEDRLQLFPRLMAVISELAAGFLGQSRQTLLTEQESIRGALLTARQQTQDALRASEARFRAVFDAAAIGMGVGDVDGNILEVNHAFQTMMGYSAEEMRRMNVGQLTHPDDMVSVWQLYQALVGGQHDYFQAEKRYYRKDGETIWCHLTVSLIRDAEGIPQYQIAMMENITERKRAEEALQRSEARFRALVLNASDIITILDADGTVRYNSPAIMMALGYEPDELVGNSVLDLVHPDDVVQVRHHFENVLVQPGATIPAEFRFRHKDGSWRWLAVMNTNLLADPAVGGVVANSRDITESKEIAARLWHQANHDALTGLPNRTLFMARLQQALDKRSSHSVAVFFLDLDGFKVVNDSLGHEYGDRLLVAVTKRLARCLKAGDLLARFGGDEFTILQGKPANATDALRLSNRLQAALATPFKLNGYKVMVTASSGIVLSSADLDASTDLLRAADVALYRAKATGKGSRAIFDSARDASALAQLDRETELRHALERGELRLHYQPKMDLDADRLVGVEALVRWQHPIEGLLPPDTFIRLAEETGLIVPLGAWVLEEACRQVKAWHEQFPAETMLQLSVNVSPVQLHTPDLVRQVEDVLWETGFPPEQLTLEITEQGLIDAAVATDRTMEALLALGVRLAIDDFGAYQAGLGYLRRWPIDVLKLDRTLVHDLGHNERSRAIVAAVVALANRLGMTVVGEGIETAEQLAMLRELGCEWGQGYFFAPPLPPAQLVAFVERWWSSRIS